MAVKVNVQPESDSNEIVLGSTGRTMLQRSGSRSRRQDILLEGESSEDIEDYDELQLDPDTLVANSRRSLDGNYRPSGHGFDGQNDAKSEPAAFDESQRRTSIEIRLEKTDRKGRYILFADDPEIKDILRRGIERERTQAVSNNSRVRLRDLVFTRRFTTFDRQNPSASESPFFGFFTLFWIAMVLLFAQVAMHNFRDYGSILGTNQVIKQMFNHEVWLLGITDGVMCAATAEGLLFQKLVHRGWLRWERGGWIVQNIWQSAYLAAVIGWTYFREWPWTHTIFVVLHGLVFLMKQHSYAFYNGYLSAIHRRRSLLESKLKQLERMEPVASPPSSPDASKQSPGGLSRVSQSGMSTDMLENAARQRPSMATRTHTDLEHEQTYVADVAEAITSGRAIDTDQMATFENIIKSEIDDLNRELRGKSTDGKNVSSFMI